MAFGDASDGAMIMGTVIIGLMMIGVTSLGVLSAGVLTGDLASYGGSVDNIIPQAIAQTLPPWLAGVAIIGPIAGSVSPGSTEQTFVFGYYQGCLPASLRVVRQKTHRAHNRALEPGGHALRGCDRIRAGHRSARRHLEDQHVRVRRP